MDVNVKVTVDLGDRTMSLFNGISSADKAVETATETISKVLADCEAEAPVEMFARTFVKKQDEMPAQTGGPEPTPETPKEEPKKSTRRTKEQIAAEKAATVNGWDDMDDDAKLEAIKSEVTKHTKKGKSADIKFLLANFDAGRASELATEDYDAFFAAITRYGNGETVETIFPGDEDLN